MTPDIELSDMAIFVRVVEARSFTQAARLLGMPKSTVSRRVGQLEAQLGVRLLQRTTRAVRTTDIGSAYFERCVRIIAEAREANEAVALAHASPRGKLRVTAPVVLGATFLGSITSEFLCTYPDVSVDIELMDQRVDLVAEGFDIGLRIDHQAHDSAFFARRLGPARFMLCASPAYLQRTGRPRHPKDLPSHTCVRLTRGPRAASWTLEGPEGEVTVPVSGRMAVNNMALALSGALAGLGIAVLPSVLALPEVQAGRLERVLEPWRPPEATIHAVYPSNRHLSSHVRLFLELLSDRLARAL